MENILPFIKMHGTGNDYICIDLFQKIIEKDFSKIAQKISQRKFSIGSDGLILIKPWVDGDGEMVMYNPDGSIAEMCGNGLCCVAKHIYDHYQKGRKSLKILTGAGVKIVSIKEGENGKAEKITVDLGKPIFEGHKIPTVFDKLKILNEKITINKQELNFSAVSMGNPHCVIFVNDLKNFPVEKLGSQIEVHKNFPQRVNIEFVQILNRQELIQRTWERGVGETLACGTGGAAVAVMSHLLDHTGTKITIHFQGGDIEYEYNKNKSVKMTGPAIEVFRGKIKITDIADEIIP